MPEEEHFSLIVTNLTREQQAIVARQDKMESAINSTQVLLATLVEQHRAHEQNMQQFAESIKDLHKDAVATSQILATFKTQLEIVKTIGTAVCALVIGYLFQHFIH